MDELIQMMRVTLGTAFALYLTTQGFHWNVEGRDFYQAHGLFGSQYEEQLDAIDKIAENIRSLDEYAPQSMVSLQSLSLIESLEYDHRMSFEEMSTYLMQAHDILISHMNEVLALAERENENGIANFIGGRIEEHQKQRWMLRASAANS